MPQSSFTARSAPYIQIQNGEQYIGGIPPANPQSHAPAHWLPYFLVQECEGMAAKAKGLGARFCVEPVTIEHVGRMSILTDPQGAAFAIFQPFSSGR